MYFQQFSLWFTFPFPWTSLHTLVFTIFSFPVTCSNWNFPAPPTHTQDAHTWSSTTYAIQVPWVRYPSVEPLDCISPHILLSLPPFFPASCMSSLSGSFSQAKKSTSHQIKGPPQIFMLLRAICKDFSFHWSLPTCIIVHLLCYGYSSRYKILFHHVFDMNFPNEWSFFSYTH